MFEASDKSADQAANESEHASIKVAVVGHTNSGKTSLIRTLLRDDCFGDIDDAAGTTRSVEKSQVFADDAEVLSLFDTPGFEDSSALLQELELFAKTVETRLPTELLQAFIQHEKSFPDFEQEIKVLKQAINSDVLLYVIDVREPLLGKYRDEIEILSTAGKPILPVFNFIKNNEKSLTRWREQMASFNLHAALEFDSVAFEFEAEKRLYQKLQSLLEVYYDRLQTLIDYRQRVWQNLNQAAAHRIFLLLTEVACYRKEVMSKNGVSTSDVTEMQNFVRHAEQQALADLLNIFSFTQLEVELTQLAVVDGRWELDIFSPNLLKDFGLNIGASAISGAAMGAGIDLMVGGLTLGGASVLGAVLGASWATLRNYQQELQAAWRGHKWLCVNDDTVSVLYLRQRQLLHRLTRRGHAAQNQLKVFNQPEHHLPKEWHKLLNILRQNPQWQKNLSSRSEDAGSEYNKAKSQVMQWLLSDE